MTQKEKVALWTDRINAWQTTQHSVSHWCKVNSVNHRSMKNWISKLRGTVTLPPEETPPPTQWLALTMPSDAPSSEPETPLLLTIGSATLTITGSFNTQLLKQVVMVLQETC